MIMNMVYNCPCDDSVLVPLRQLRKMNISQAFANNKGIEKNQPVYNSNSTDKRIQSNHQNQLINGNYSSFTSLMKNSKYNSNSTSNPNHNYTSTKRMTSISPNPSSQMMHVRRSYGSLPHNYNHKVQFHNKADLRSNCLPSDVLSSYWNIQNEQLSQQEQQQQLKELQTRLKQQPINKTAYKKLRHFHEQINDAYYFAHVQTQQAQEREKARNNTIQRVKMLSRSKSASKNDFNHFCRNQKQKDRCVQEALRLRDQLMTVRVPKIMGRVKGNREAGKGRNEEGHIDKNANVTKTNKKPKPHRKENHSNGKNSDYFSGLAVDKNKANKKNILSYTIPDQKPINPLKSTELKNNGRHNTSSQQQQQQYMLPTSSLSRHKCQEKQILQNSSSQPQVNNSVSNPNHNHNKVINSAIQSSISSKAKNSISGSASDNSIFNAFLTSSRTTMTMLTNDLNDEKWKTKNIKQDKFQDNNDENNDRNAKQSESVYGLKKHLNRCTSAGEFLQGQRVKNTKQAFIYNWQQGPYKQPKFKPQPQQQHKKSPKVFCGKNLLSEIQCNNRQQYQQQQQQIQKSTKSRKQFLFNKQEASSNNSINNINNINNVYNNNNNNNNKAYQSNCDRIKQNAKQIMQLLPSFDD